MDCSELSHEEHEILKALKFGTTLRRRPSAKTGIRMYRTTVSDLSKLVDLSPSKLRDHLVDLETSGFLTYFDYGGVGEGDRTCICERRDASVATRPPRIPSTLCQEGEGGEGGAAGQKGPKGPKGHRARRAREAELREERLRVILEKDPERLNSNDLAHLFRHRLQEQDDWASRVPGNVSHIPLAKNIASWIREGTSPAVIREMIEAFVHDPKLLAEGDLAWKVFVNRRAVLASRAYRTVVLHSDDLGWGEVRGSIDDDDDLGWDNVSAN